MANKVRFDEEGLKNALQTIIAEIHDTNDPSELNELRRLFRKHVPLFSRAYVAAVLLKRARLVGSAQYSSPSAPVAPKVKRPEPRRVERPVRAEKPARVANNDNGAASGASAQAPGETSRENMTTLFVGIGRTRRVYPRDIMGLLMETSGLQKEEVGSIKILDNYSFVDVDTEKAQGVIDSLNNVEYRGRTLSVNFAKKKE